MSFFSRAATFAALTLSLAGLLATSTPGLAAELDRAVVAPIAQPAESVSSDQYQQNTQAPLAVPDLPLDEAMSLAEPAGFASLAEAVAAQSDTAAEEALRCLAGAIYFEAQGEPLAGQLAVAEVIINRSKSGRFPSDVCSVITQRGQFGFVRGGAIPAIDAARAGWKRAVAVAKVALADSWNSPASNALYFNASRRSPGARIVRVAAIGNHVFYR
ncbi:cell wall hydrolase [Sphingomonas sp.]|jgi:spore germination cell wall hydrolase CwlJ-like protein|uniref:cell wall hydrolase n=1 Tax=Sphingomonas sp. TaxID=28214 RepID=UPI002ED8A501